MTHAGTSDTNARDHDLIKRIREDDTNALSQLVRQYASDLRGVAYGIVRRIDFAEDIVQSTFIKLWNMRASLNISGNVAAYLRKTTRNVALDHLRHEQAEQRAYGVVGQSYVVGSTTSANTGDTNLEVQDLEAAIHKVLYSLQPQVREIYLMCRFQEMSYEEIASALGISVISVRSQMSRAVRKLAEALKDWA